MSESKDLPSCAENQTDESTHTARLVPRMTEMESEWLGVQLAIKAEH